MLAGDFVAVDVYAEAQEDRFDLCGAILEVVGLRPLRTIKLDDVVTSYNPHARTGAVRNNIFFKRECCSPGYIPSRGDKVSYSLHITGILSDLESLIGRGDNLFPRYALIRGMHETSHADWWDARVTWQLTPLSLLRA